MTRLLKPSELDGLIGHEVGVSPWVEVTQAMIDTFADVTVDDQFIHTDPARAAGTDFGGTIAHGFLTLSLFSHFYAEAVPALEGAAMGLNYGFDSVRFLTPVRSGKRVRARFTLSGVKARGEGRVQMTWAVTVEIEGEDRPALVADWLVLGVLAA
ncbi:MaoC family dehydratase [Pararhodobacter sp. CCB-MM2]|uniref:MaoC family dehydratase n=1 Tax=Pararhodobacter sp. CCB-MM2 TaxID=1786003 RepID=UPI0008376F34|nr:MaoC family dehydratase [Pararhodobacter sp. CCB-MM2]